MGMTAELQSAAYEAFCETMHNVRHACAMKSPKPIEEFHAKVKVSWSLWRIICDTHQLVPGPLVWEPHFMWEGVRCEIQPPGDGVWVAAAAL